MKALKLLLTFLFIVIMSSSAALAADELVSPDVPLDSKYYEYIEKLDGMGYIDSMLMGVKPYSRVSMAKLVIEAKRKLEKKSGQDYIKAYIAELEKEFAAEIAGIQDGRQLEKVKLRSFTAEVGAADFEHDKYNYKRKIAASFQPFAHNNDGYRYGDGGNMILSAELSGMLENNIAVSLRPRVSYDSGQNGQLNLTEAYIKTRIGKLSIEGGKQSVLLGQGKQGTFALSNNAEPQTMLKISYLEPQKFRGFLKGLGTINFTFMLSRLEGNRAEIADEYNLHDYNHPFLFTLRTDMNLFDNLTIGLERVSMLGGKRHGLDSSDWQDWLVGTNAEKSSDDRWNDIAGIDFRYRFPGVHFYGEIYGEDQAGYLPSKVAWRFGTYLPRLSKDGRWEATLEAAKTSNGWYNHWTFNNGWTYKDNIIGDFMGNDAEKFYINIGHQLGGVDKISFNAMRINMNGNYNTKLNEFWLNYSRKMNDSLSLAAMLGLATIDNERYENKDYFVKLGLKWTY